MELNKRKVSGDSVQKKCHILVEFPHPELECVIVQWELFNPTLFIQLKKNPKEPLQFTVSDGKVHYPAELDGKLQNFIDPATGRTFIDEAYKADIVFSARAFSLLQPEPDLVLPAQALWECRAEALSEMKVADAPLIKRPS
jgi:hypothetical protein